MGNTSAVLNGLGQGVLRGLELRQRMTEYDDNKRERQEDREYRTTERNDAKKLRVSLADAAKPVTVNENAMSLAASGTPVSYEDPGVANSDFRQARMMGLADVEPPKAAITVDGKAYANRAEADAAAVAQNTPDAMALRMGTAYRQAGQPVEALNIEQRQAQISAAKAAQAKKFQEEGLFDAVRALRAGDAGGVTKAFNTGGEWKLDGDPVMTSDERNVPGIGKIPSYTAKVKMVGPDGKVVERSFNSHDLSMQMMPYEKALELQRKGTDSDTKATYQGALIDAKSAALDAKTAAASAKASAGGGAGGKVQKTFVDSKGFMVGVFRDGTSKRLTDEDGEAIRADSVEKRVDTLAKNLQSNSREYRRMPYAEVRKAAEGMLTGQEAGAEPATPRQAPGLSDARKPVPATAKPNFSNLWK